MREDPEEGCKGRGRARDVPLAWARGGGSKELRNGEDRNGDKRLAVGTALSSGACVLPGCRRPSHLPLLNGRLHGGSYRATARDSPSSKAQKRGH